MKFPPFPSTVAAVAVAGLLVGGCSPAPAGTGSHPAGSPAVQWRACPDGVEDLTHGGPPRLRCVTVSVPLDYDDPGGTQIDLTISRLPSGNPDKRRGVLLLNPGGPGGSGLDQPTFLASHGIPHSVLDSYDLIGMDTRGVGHSSAISCGFTDEVKYYGAVPPYAADDTAFAEQVATAKEVAARCAAHDQDGRLRQVSTANTARDLDRIRAALGEEKASFLGYSYGTALGAAYASMFPDRSDRIVLDSNIGDTHLDVDGLRRYSRGMEETFPDFARWAALRHDRFGLGRTAQQVRDTYFRLAERLDRHPVDGVNGILFRLSTFVTLYNQKSYEQAAHTWNTLLNPGEAAPADSPSVDHDALSPHDNTWSVFLAVTCNDVEWPADVATYRQAVREDREAYPLFGAAAANIMPCAYWRHEPTEPPVTVDDQGPTNILIAQNQRDPVTPLRGGELLDEKFGERSRLVTVDGSGHGVYVLGKNPCAQHIVTSYLVDGTLPEHDTTCPPATP
ncbi:alpha/beta hydrolase [Nocardia sp. NPDC058633]|uniref:alpha/beta hydrolase n=1 Tax=Nocardia sp. NPDC058633 TaxID=3346568 RepID=UPI0036656C9C